MHIVCTENEIDKVQWFTFTYIWCPRKINYVQKTEKPQIIWRTGQTSVKSGFFKIRIVDHESSKPSRQCNHSQYTCALQTQYRRKDRELCIFHKYSVLPHPTGLPSRVQLCEHSQRRRLMARLLGPRARTVSEWSRSLLTTKCAR